MLCHFKGEGGVYKGQKSHNPVGGGGGGGGRGSIIPTVQSFHGDFRYIPNIIGMRRLIGIDY